jgi:DNA-binding CsgD family transcriptional regulator
MTTGQQDNNFIDLTAKLICSINGPDFPECVLAFTKTYAAVDHFSLFVYGANLQPVIIESASSWKQKKLNQAELRYQQEEYRFDPVMEQIRLGKSTDHGRGFVRILTADLVQSDHPWAKGYIEREHAERISLLRNIRSVWYLVSFYRSTMTGVLRSEELAQLQTAVKIVLPAVEQHLASPLISQLKFTEKPSTEWLEQLLVRAGNKLSPREIEVCARALLGMTRTGIALDLAISESTVNTLKKRCYTKLNISSLNELFALCLKQLSAE